MPRPANQRHITAKSFAVAWMKGTCPVHATECGGHSAPQCRPRKNFGLSRPVAECAVCMELYHDDMCKVTTMAKWANRLSPGNDTVCWPATPTTSCCQPQQQPLCKLQRKPLEHNNKYYLLSQQHNQQQHSKLAKACCVQRHPSTPKRQTALAPVPLRFVTHEGCVSLPLPF